MSYCGQQGRQFKQSCVLRILEPALDEDPVLRLQLEVLSDVVHDDHSANVSAYAGQVFHIEPAEGKGVLPVESERDALLVREVLKRPVSIVLHGSCEYHDFEVL